jgi:hypothetical protein
MWRNSRREICACGPFDPKAVETNRRRTTHIDLDQRMPGFDLLEHPVTDGELAII